MLAQVVLDESRIKSLKPGETSEPMNYNACFYGNPGTGMHVLFGYHPTHRSLAMLQYVHEYWLDAAHEGHCLLC